MRSRWVLAALGILAVALAAALGVFVGRQERPVAENVRRAASSTASEGTGARLDAAPAEEPSTAPTLRPTRELGDGTWIRGRVVLPPGTPATEMLEVLARTVSLEDEPGGIAAVDADGRFAVAFPPDAEEGWLELRSRYLYLEHEVDVDLDEPPAEVVLEPKLGGRVEGVLVPSKIPESSAATLAGTRVELLAARGSGSESLVRRVAIADDEARFEVSAVPLRTDYDIEVKHPAFVPVFLPVSITPGQTARVRLDLHPFARVCGRVLGPDGNPIGIASISRYSLSERGDSTAEDGTFCLPDFAPGPCSLFVQGRQCLPQTVELGDLTEGQVVSDVEIRLRSGLIHGVVERADGSPAPECSVNLFREQLTREDVHNLACYLPIPNRNGANGGKFRIEVSSEGPFDLIAREGAGGIAIVEGVRPGDPPLTVRLQPAESARGRVIDDLGEPITAFSVQVTYAPKRDGSLQWRMAETHFRSDDGTFSFGGLGRGSWVFRASTLLVQGEPTEPTEVPNSSPVVLVVPRAAELSGIVLDPSGRPVELAQVEGPGDTIATERTGRFHFGHAQPGEAVLRATSKVWAPSEELTLQAKPGEHLEGLVLRLRRGGRIAGRILLQEGGRNDGLTVSFEDDDGHRIGDTTSSSSGSFESDCLPPGRYTVDVYRGADRMDASSFEATAVVAEDQVTQVVLGRP
jgi:hypothetical protein